MKRINVKMVEAFQLEIIYKNETKTVARIIVHAEGRHAKLACKMMEDLLVPFGERLVTDLQTLNYKKKAE